jgi:small conductance mechanosensitive channel
LKVGIAYSHNSLDVIKLLEEAILSLGIVGENRKLQVGIDEFSDSAINIAIRLWTPTVNLYDTKYKAYAKIYSTLTEANITIPFPQRDLHIHQVASNPSITSI